MILLGSIVNGAAIAAGGFVGLFVGKLLPDRMQKTLMSALALLVIGIAVPGISDSQKPLVPILSMVLGTVLGELLDLDSAVIRLGDWLQRKTGGRGKFTDGFVNGTMVFAVGAMAIMGALNSGLQGDHTVLLSKSVIDGVSSVIFASTLGVGVLSSPPCPCSCWKRSLPFWPRCWRRCWGQMSWRRSAPSAPCSFWPSA